MTTVAVRPPTWPQFTAWALCGASAAFVLVAAFTIGPLAILPAGLFAVLACRLGGANVSAWGAVAGAGAWAFVPAWLNRDGPGDVCLRTARETGCDQEWSPWPFLAVGVVVVTAAVTVFELRRRAARRSST